MDGDPTLFGALPGRITSLILQVDTGEDGQRGRVLVQAFMANRRDPMRLSIDNLPDDRLSTAIGYCVPLVVKSHYVGTAMMRRHFWSVWRTLSLAGWDVGIKGCGKERKG